VEMVRVANSFIDPDNFGSASCELLSWEKIALVGLRLAMHRHDMVEWTRGRVK